MERLLAPSMEYLLQMMLVVENRRQKLKKMTMDSPFLLVNREAFEIVNRMNRMPGILNEAGWTVWSYQVEGLRTFDGDGSRWMWRESSIRSWSSQSDADGRYGARSAGSVVASVLVAMISVFGLCYGFTRQIDNFSGASILAFSAVSYALMSISYFLYARRLRASGWFAPLWFLTHVPASVLTILEIRRIHRGRQTSGSDSRSSTPRPTLRAWIRVSAAFHAFQGARWDLAAAQMVEIVKNGECGGHADQRRHDERERIIRDQRCHHFPECEEEEEDSAREQHHPIGQCLAKRKGRLLPFDLHSAHCRKL